MIPQAQIRYLRHPSVFRVVSTLYGMESPVGPRLARKEPLPHDSYDFKTREEAEEARKKLQEYFDEYHKPTPRRRRRRR